MTVFKRTSFFFLPPLFFSILLLVWHDGVFAAYPAWYLKSATNSYELYGYGQGATINDAKARALLDIAQALEVQVEGSMTISESLHNDNFESAVSQDVKTSSSSVIVGAVLKEFHESEGVWYVLLTYDTRSLGLKFKSVLKSRALEEETDNYLSESSLVSEINQQVGVKLRYQVLREDDLWKIRYKDVKFTLTESELIKTFKPNKGKSIGLKLNKKIYYPEDVMTFDVTSRDKGFVSILLVEKNGKVGVLYSNIESHSKMVVPSKDSDEEIIVSNPEQKVLHEMYVAIWSENPRDLSLFEDIQSDYLDDSNYKFGDLTNLLDTVDYSSAVIKIK